MCLFAVNLTKDKSFQKSKHHMLYTPQTLLKYIYTVQYNLVQPPCHKFYVN